MNTREDWYDVAVIGGGTAGLTAGLFACRAGLKTLLLERVMPGGQIVNAERIENFPGFPQGISGAEFGPLLLEQASQYGLGMGLGEVERLAKDGDGWALSGYEIEARSRCVIIAGGSTLRSLGVPGESELHGAGVSYCAACDGAFFQDQVVGVVGGGDSALDEAMVLTEFASRVVMLVRADSFDGQKVLQDRVLSHPGVDVRWKTQVDAVLGDRQVEGVSVTDLTSGETSRLDLDGLFIYVGLEPNTAYLKDLLPLDNGGHIPTDLWMRTPVPGILAAGDIRQSSASQLVSSAGDGATAAIAAQRYIQSGVWGA